jgi:hypothetical protein
MNREFKVGEIVRVSEQCLRRATPPARDAP